MDDIVAARIMTSPVEEVEPAARVAAAGRRMAEADIGSLVVTDEQRLAGILTSTDFVRMVADGVDPTETPVSQYMSAKVVTTTAQTPITAVAETMSMEGIHHVPVIDEENGVIGIIASSDLTRYLSTARLSEIG